MIRALWMLLPAALTALLALGRPPEVLHGALATIAILVMPGVAWARGRDALARAFTAGWRGVLSAPITWLVGVVTGLGPWGTLAAAAVLTFVGAALPRRERVPLAPGPRLGMGALAVALVTLAWSERVALARPLERYLWVSDADMELHGTLPDEAVGFRERRGTALRLYPRSTQGSLVGPMRGPVLLVARGPVGATVEVGGTTGHPPHVMELEAEPVVHADEGPVQRYLDRAVATHRIDRDLAPGEPLPLRFDAPGATIVHVIPSSDALWALHARGELRLAHYYQLLNLQEQVQWARELYAGRRVTDVQPPLQAWFAAGPLGVTGGDLPTQASTFLLGLALLGASGLACVRAWAPGAPLLAWTLPALATGVCGRLMVEPGSIGMPDTLYAAAALGAVAALRGPRVDTGGYASLGALAQLLRYPGALVVALAGALAGEPRMAARMLAGVCLLAAAFGLYGLGTGALGGWITTLARETGPEHWHGDVTPGTLLPRVPVFLAQLLAYAGGTPVFASLALLGRPRTPATRGGWALLGTVAAQTLLLGTIDHHPSHYFLPLVAMSATALALASARRHGAWWALIGAGGLAWAWADVDVVG
jgi:hypothetical protein